MFDESIFICSQSKRVDLKFDKRDNFPFTKLHENSGALHKQVSILNYIEFVLFQHNTCQLFLNTRNII